MAELSTGITRIGIVDGFRPHCESIESSSLSSRICEFCGKEHDGSYGSGRFCSYGAWRDNSEMIERKELSNLENIDIFSLPDFQEIYKRESIDMTKFDNVWVWGCKSS